METKIISFEINIKKFYVKKKNNSLIETINGVFSQYTGNYYGQEF